MTWREEALVLAGTAAFRRRVAAAAGILEAAARTGRVGISVSWGKDSTALLGLAMEVLGEEVIAFHLATPYRLPGWEIPERHFAGLLGKRYRAFDHRLSLEEVLARLSEIGLGYEREIRSRQGPAGATAKKSLGDEACAAMGIEVRCLGLRAEESGRRAIAVNRWGLLRDEMAWPIARWTAADVWAYIVSRGLPYHPMYDLETHGWTRQTLRNGGWLTVADPGRLPWLRRHYPEQYQRLVDHFPQVRGYGG